MDTDLNFHDKETNKIKGDITRDIDLNIKKYESLFKNCDDVVKRKILIGRDRDVAVYVSYIDVMVDRRVIEEALVEKLLYRVDEPKREIIKGKNSSLAAIKNLGIASADIKEVKNFDEICTAVLSGDTAVFIEGSDIGIVLATRGWPNRGVNEPDAEAVIRGSKEGFNEVIRYNTVLIRRRIRDTNLKIVQKTVGTRSRTDVAVVYVKGIVRESILQEVMDKLDDFLIDGIFDSGMLEPFLDDKWKSVFPMTQATQRPDKVASAVLEGRIGVVVDNTPFVLLLPTTINCFYQASEDYYDNWVLSSFLRILRYFAVFFALSIPGLYIAITNYHPSMLPTDLVYSIVAARVGVPFPTIFEVLIMELEFELLREAGVRLPAQIGYTIGIVGGLIIGQAAVEANIVSPIIVVVVSLTAIASFAIPSYSLSGAYRLIKYFVLLLCSILGIYGFWLSVLIIMIHLVSLKSFGIPYFMPYVSGDINKYNDVKDSFFRLPLFTYKKTPIFAKGKKNRLKILK